MNRIVHNKLVRDGIPNIISNTGKKANVKSLNDEEYLSELKKKLQEEVNEFLISENIEELADILEVIDALTSIKGASLNQVLEIKEQKKADRGGLNSKVFLESVDDDATLPISEEVNFIGIDVHLSRFTAACLDEDLKILFVEDFSLAELMEKINHVSPQIIAVDAPLGLNIGLMDDEEYRKKLGLMSDKHHNKKVSEYELTRRGIFIYPSPKTMNDISGWKSWVGTGLQLYESLKQLGYETVNTDEFCERVIVEVFPHASFTTLADRLLENKSTDTGLQERIQVLEKAGVNGISNYITGSRHIKGDKLDAIIAAYTAYTIWSKQASFVGDFEEGVIALPVKTLKERYTREQSIAEVKNDAVLEMNDSTDSDSLIYIYKNVDAVVWLKYFTLIGNSPSIYDAINFNVHPGLRVTLHLVSEQGTEVESTFESMQNRVDGMKAVLEDKQKLKEFWGSHGDKKEYWVRIVRIVMA